MRHLLFLLLISSSTFGQLPSNSMGATIFPIESEVLGYEYDIWVSLPDDYDSTQAYPVLCLLDAEWRFDITRSLVRELAINDKCPQHIIIGIPQIDWPHRLKNLTFTDSKVNALNEPDTLNFTGADVTGGGDQFLKFIEDEVIPFAEEKYSTNGFNVMMGHSLSGYFTAFAMLKSTRFQAFQIFDASIWFNGADVVHQLSAHLPEDKKASAFIGYAQGGEPLDRYFTVTNDSLRDLLKQFPNIRSASEFYTEEYHNSMYMFGVIDGMTFLYDGYDFGWIGPTDTVTAADYINHFKQFSEKVNFTFHPKRDGFRWVGFANYSQGKWEQALEAYSYLGEDYNDDSWYLTEAATCYENLDRIDEAINYLQMVLELDPDNDTIKKKLKSLKKKR